MNPEQSIGKKAALNDKTESIMSYQIDTDVSRLSSGGHWRALGNASRRTADANAVPSVNPESAAVSSDGRVPLVKVTLSGLVSPLSI